MSNFAVLHITKFKGSSGGIGAHIDRKHTPKNADPDKAHLNREFIKSPTGSLQKDIDKRISEGYNGKREIRKDAVKAVGVILSGSHQQMKRLKAEGRLEEWSQANLKFAQERFGKDNLVRFSLHMDEKTPHVHAVFTPIAEDGRLHYKSFIDGKKDLTKLQNDYAQSMERFGLSRGLEQSRAKHITTRQYYAHMHSEPVEIQTNLIGRPKQGEEERINDIVANLKGNLVQNQAELERKSRQVDMDKQIKEKLKNELKNAHETNSSNLTIVKKALLDKDPEAQQKLRDYLHEESRQAQRQNRGFKAGG